MSNKLTKATANAMYEALVSNLRLVTTRLDPADAKGIHAMVEIETFCAVAMRVMSKTNLSKLRDETRTVEIAARIAGHVVVDTP